MGLISAWILLLWIAALGAFGALQRLRRPKSSVHKVDAVPIAHSHRLLQLPEYQKILHRYNVMLLAVTLLFSLSLLIAVVLSARPAKISVVTPAQKNRDIMLCLDVSPSVQKADVQLLNYFSQIVNGFSGQRFGLVIFNSSAVTIIPLTDDYELINDQIKQAKQGVQDVIDGKAYDFIRGTNVGEDQGSSLVGDGLASCVTHLGNNQSHRTQSVILATDNEVAGKPIVTTAQAVALAKQRNVRIYAVDPGPSQEDTLVHATDTPHVELKIEAQMSGGNYFLLTDTTGAQKIINNIAAQEASYFVGSPQLAKTDQPAVLIYVLMILLPVALILKRRLGL